MKKLIVLLALLLIGCGEDDREKYPITAKMYSGSTFSIPCDSVQMISTKEAFIWREGRRMKIVSDEKIKVDGSTYKPLKRGSTPELDSLTKRLKRINGSK